MKEQLRILGEYDRKLRYRWWSGFFMGVVAGIWISILIELAVR